MRFLLYSPELRVLYPFLASTRNTKLFIEEFFLAMGENAREYYGFV